MPSPRWKRRPPGSNWGDFGPDDCIGRLNLLSREKILQGIDCVKEGRSFCLSLPLDFPGGNTLNPRRHPPQLTATTRHGRANYVYPFSIENAQHTDVCCDDIAVLTLQYSTQWDSLAHMGALFDANGDGVPEAVFYNGWRAGEDVRAPPIGNDDGKPRVDGCDAGNLSISKMAETGVQGRGVLVDLERHIGRERVLVGYDQLMEICEGDGVSVEAGDMVCLYTGFADIVLEMERHPDANRLHKSCAALDGRDEKLLRWISDSELTVLIADNYAVEGYPSRPGKGMHAMLPLHEHCLFKLGVHLGELFYLRELALWLRANGRSRFLLTAPPLRLPGAAGSPVSAVATV